VRVALVHDWLTGLRGGERVLDVLAGLWPDAELYTLFHVPGATTPRIDALRVRTSPLGRIPGSGRHYRKLLPLHPWAARQLRVEECDLVVSVSHAVAKAVRVGSGIPHLCYCLTPMRYVWDQIDVYLGRGPRRVLAAPLVAALRRFDRLSSRPSQVTRFLAISRAIAERVRRHYGRDAAVLYPPIDTETFHPNGRSPEDFYLLVGAFVPYKREDLAIETLGRIGRRVIVVGEGPRRDTLQRSAARCVEFTGRVPDAELADLYARCRALLYPQEEDFGLCALEAQACGRPVIAYGRGGATETVLPLRGAPDAAAGATGVWFEAQTEDALVGAIHRFEAAEPFFDPKLIRSHAERFSTPRFLEEFQREVHALLEGAPP
jgi:glycosyltransferase involved in cell wall biosynthesis